MRDQLFRRKAIVQEADGTGLKRVLGPRAFRVPLVPAVPLAAMGMCAYLMFGLPAVTWERFGLWLVAGLVLYFLFGLRHSALQAASLERPVLEAAPLAAAEVVTE